MPINDRKDFVGRYMQWGDHGVKYYYTNLISQMESYTKALRQGRAIEYKKYRH